MFCPSCNAPNRDDAKFCKSCGLRFEQAKTPEKENIAPASEQAVAPAPPPVDTREQAASLPSEQRVFEEEEDPTLAPTLILSPEKLLAYRSRAWRRSALEEEQNQQGTPPNAGEAEQHAHVADMPTLMMTPAEEMPKQGIGTESVGPVADIPTVLMSAAAASEQDQGTSASPPSFDATPAPALEEHVEQKEATQPMSEQPISQAETSPDVEQPAGTETPEQATPQEGDFAPLAEGTLLAERYEITHVENVGTDEHTYQVIDHQGYQHCWNCQSTTNAEGDEYCIDCGASLLEVPYILHEYPAASQTGAEATVLHGAIINSFIEQGRTYAVEQTAQNQDVFPNGVHLLAAGDSDAGDVRRSEPNEDSVLVLQLQRVHESNAVPAGVFIVADGMGGHDYGQVASRMAVNLIAERMTRELLGTPLQSERNNEEAHPFDEDGLVGLLRGTIEEANLALCQKNQQDKTDMGSTLTGFMIVEKHAYIVNVGDSRTYMVRGGQIYKLTSDHSLVGQLVAGGLIEPDDVYTHPQRSQIFRSLGDKPNVQIDIFKQELSPGDIMLSCSDGLWEMIRDPQIESILNGEHDPQSACARLIEVANANGGEDNVSAIVVFVR